MDTDRGGDSDSGNATLDFLLESTGIQLIAILEAHPELATEGSIQALDSIAAGRADDPKMPELLEFLRRFREVGPKGALLEMENPETYGPAEFRRIYHEVAALWAEFGREQTLESINALVTGVRRAVDHPARNHILPLMRYVPLVDAGNAHWWRFHLFATQGDLDRALEFHREAVSGARDAAAEVPELLEVALPALAQDIFDLYAATSEIPSLNEAIELCAEAEGCTRQGTEERLRLQLTYGLALSERYVQLGDLEDLDEAIEQLRSAAADSSPNSQSFFDANCNLSFVLEDRFEAGFDQSDRQDALTAARHAVVGAGLFPSRAPVYLASLGRALLGAFDTEGALELLEESIDVHRAAISLFPASSVHLGRAHSNLANALVRKFSTSGRLADLDGAISNLEIALSDKCRGPVNRANAANTLGACLHLKSDFVPNDDGVARAIDLIEPLVGRMDQKSPDRPALVFTLARLKLARFDDDEQTSDLDESIALWRAGVESPNVGSSEARGLMGLAAALHSLYLLKGNRDVLEEAIQQNRAGLDVAERTHERIGSARTNLALALQARYSITQDLRDFSECSQAHRDACETAEAGPDARIGASSNWFNWAMAHSEWVAAADAAEFMLSAALELRESQALRTHSLIRIRKTAGVSSFGAYAMIRADRPQRAAIALELGQAFLLSRAIQLDTRSLLGLRDSHVALFHKYERSARRLAAHRRIELQDEFSSQSGEDGLRSIVQAQADLDAVLRSIRQIENFEDFLGEPNWETLAAAAKSQPLIYLASAGDEGFAIAILPTGDVQCLQIPDLGRTALDAQLSDFTSAYSARRYAPQNWPPALRRVCEWLWTSVMRPMDELISGYDRFVLVPVGRLAALPIHAAQCGEESVLDKWAVTYAPNARAASMCQRITDGDWDTGLLAVDDPQPVRASSLEGSGGEIAAALAVTSGPPHILRNEAATLEAVTSALRSRQVAHLSCHGKYDWNEPLDGGLLLANDELLTLRELLASEPLDCGLVVLSACESARIDQAVPEEAIGLATALVQAGVKSVVAPLWSCPVAGTAELMKLFYREFAKQRDPAVALQRAQLSMRRSDGGLADPTHWASFVHVGGGEPHLSGMRTDFS